MRLGGQYRCVEALEVPYLQNALDAWGGRNQLADPCRVSVKERLPANVHPAPDRRNGTPGAPRAPDAPARYLRHIAAPTARAGHFRPGAAVRPHRDAVSHLVRGQPRAGALYPWSEYPRRPVRAGCGFFLGA